MCSFIAGFAQTFPTEMNLKRVLFYINTEGYLVLLVSKSFRFAFLAGLFVSFVNTKRVSVTCLATIP